jgi:hypothetical protein
LQEEETVSDSTFEKVLPAQMIMIPRITGKFGVCAEEMLESYLATP